MPHFHIDYSANLEEAIDMRALCEAIRAEAAQIDAFPLAGIRVRATCVDYHAMADRRGRVSGIGGLRRLARLAGTGKARHPAEGR